MNRTVSLNRKQKEKSAYELYFQGAKVATGIVRLRAEADRVYIPDSKIHKFVTDIHDEVDEYLNDTAVKLQKLSDIETNISLVGELSLNEMRRRKDWITELLTELKRRADRLDERIARAEVKSNIINLEGRRQR